MYTVKKFSLTEKPKIVGHFVFLHDAQKAVADALGVSKLSDAAVSWVSDSSNDFARGWSKDEDEKEYVEIHHPDWAARAKSG